jgi:hypothetical protein
MRENKNSGKNMRQKYADKAKRETQNFAFPSKSVKLLI